MFVCEKEKDLKEYLANNLDELAVKTGIPKTRLCDKALELLFEKNDKGENVFA
jgi:hypothetical protein